RQQANPPRARPWSEAEATFSNRPEELLGHPVLIRVSSGYPGTKGGLPTCYSPVRRFPQAEAWFSLDLHVLSAPPAFVLSQDQTLREGVFCRQAGRPFTSSMLLKGLSLRTDEVKTLAPRAGRSRLRLEVLDIEERSLLSFQRPAPGLV